MPASAGIRKPDEVGLSMHQSTTLPEKSRIYIETKNDLREFHRVKLCSEGGVL